MHKVWLPIVALALVCALPLVSDRAQAAPLHRMSKLRSRRRALLRTPRARVAAFAVLAAALGARFAGAGGGR